MQELVLQKENYLNYRYNKQITDIIDAKKNIEEFLRYRKFISQQASLLSTKKLLEQLDSLLELFEEITTFNIDEEDFDLSDDVQEILNALDHSAVENYTNGLIDLRDKREKASLLSRILADLQSSRNQLIDRFKSYQNALTQKDTECPFCGQDWGNGSLSQNNDELLLRAIENQTLLLQGIVEGGNDELAKAFENFKENLVGPVEQLIEQFIAANNIDKAFVTRLTGLNIKDFERRSEILSDLSIDYEKFLNELPSVNSKLLIEEFIEVLRGLLKPNQPSIDYLKFTDVYKKFFKSDPTILTIITPADVLDKVKYIDWQYTVFQNQLIHNLQTDYEERKAQFEDASLLFNKLKDIIDTYKKSLNDYNKTLIRDIEILFHIYSGRIVQDFQGGLGLFIKEDKGIKFLTDPTKTFDAVFSMSSGQLAALIISFTLALNKKYSQNKVLFIDDPVQSMDELNVAGFIEVLRNDFNDRQEAVS